LLPPLDIRRDSIERSDDLAGNTPRIVDIVMKTLVFHERSIGFRQDDQVSLVFLQTERHERVAGPGFQFAGAAGGDDDELAAVHLIG
jgi:hypothetical protein